MTNGCSVNMQGSQSGKAANGFVSPTWVLAKWQGRNAVQSSVWRDHKKFARKYPQVRSALEYDDDIPSTYAPQYSE